MDHEEIGQLSTGRHGIKADRAAARSTSRYRFSNRMEPKMFAFRGHLQLLSILSLGAWVVGCSPTSDRPRMSENNAVTLGVVLASWKANDRKLAMEQFGALDWQNPNVLKGLPGEELSESDFMALSPDEQSRIQAEVWPALKEIAKGAIAAGEEAERQGRKEDSTRYYEATVQLGDHLSDSKHSLLFQEFGKAIKNFAMNKLNC